MKKVWSLIVIVYFVSTIGNSTLIKPHIDEFLLSHFPKKSKAIIIDEKNTIGNNLNNQLSYIYLFEIGDKKYKNNAADSTLKVGDTIEVEYYKYNPTINKPLYFKH